MASTNPNSRPLAARALLGLALVTALLSMPPHAAAFDARVEAKNFAKIGERELYLTGTPEFQLLLQKQNARSPIERNRMLLEDPERAPFGNICQQRTNECAGDVRYYDWAKDGFGIRRPVLFTARSGATISGNVWATRAGPSQRPGVVITTGSVQAPEVLYWGVAATLAKHGYVVLTYDVQGQGLSDTFGEGVDRLEGFPSQAGEPFYDGTEDALDFLLSRDGKPYVPRPSCSTGTSHAAKQRRRVSEGLNARFNPLWRLVDPDRIAIAGHSLGASAVSYVGQEDARVDAIVAWDNLRPPGGPGPTGIGAVTECPAAPETRGPVPITKPAMGISNDYSIVPQPYASDPDPLGHNEGFAAYRNAGVDSMEVNIRGGTHEESAVIPGNTAPYPFGVASLRGQDVVAWYTTAWFDKYVKGDPGADDRLLTDRWLDDPRSADVDLAGDPNVLSFYLRSQYDLHLSEGGEAVCSDMRSGCPSMGPDALPPEYFYFAETMTRDRPGDQPDPCAMPQVGTDAPETPLDLPGTDAGDSIHGAGGDDRLEGGPADDCLYGDSGDDRLYGQAGNDTLEGGQGADRLAGGVGNDLLLARDGEAGDVVGCGDGADRARVDRGDRVAGDCEDVYRPSLLPGT